MNKEYAGLNDKLNWIKNINPTACFTVHHENEKYSNILSIPVYRMSWSADEKLFKKYNNKYTHDLFFAGVIRKEQSNNMRKRVYDVFHKISDDYKLNLHVAFYENNKLIGDLYKFNNDQYANLINDSKICLITTGPADLVGTRYFEVSASNKSLIMCNRMSEQVYDKIMIDKFNCVMFDDEHDFIEKFKYYIKEEDERLRIVNNAYEYFNNNLTWDKQMDNIMEKIKIHI
jgi:spore maturation protein CgeB